MNRAKRGRPPLNRRAMTPAQRQAKHRKKLREAARALHAQAEGRAYLPPTGYGRAKQQLQDQGHHFTRARREWGFEEGTFVDGVFTSTHHVIDLAKLPAHECRQRIEEDREMMKQFSVDSVLSYMQEMHVTLDELSDAVVKRAEAEQRQRDFAVRRAFAQ